jgi:Tol biopolymer transport system component
VAFKATALSWTPDGRILYSAHAADVQNIWLRTPDGGQDQQLTFEKSQNYQPTITPDGRYIVFASSRAGGSIWRMNSDGSQPVQLTAGQEAANMPQVTPDSAWAIYRTADAIWKVPVAGGEPTELLKKNSLYPTVSPDGRLLAFFTSDPEQGSGWRVEVFSLADMSRIKSLALPQTCDPLAGLRWAPDGRGLTYVSSVDGASNLWLQPLDKSAPQKLTDFKESRILSFGWAPDKNLIACVRASENVRALLITGFRHN